MAESLPMQSLSQRMEVLAALEPTPGDVQVITSNPGAAGDEGQLKLSDELITRAQQTAARIRFIEDASLLADVGGVGALLRFRI